MTEPLTADALRAALAPPAPAEAKSDLVSSTLAAYRKTAEVDAAAAATGRPNFRKAVAEVPAPAPARVATGKRANKYPADCIDCGSRVEAEAGYLAKSEDGKWAAQHQSGQCAAEALPEPQEVPPGFVKITAITGQTYVGLQPGIYTLEVATDGHRTFRVRVQSTEEDFAPGKTILEYLSGPDNERDYTGFGFLNGTRLAVWKKHQDNEDLVADAKAFLADPSQAVLAARCIRCNKTLTTPESVASMMGPHCREKGW